MKKKERKALKIDLKSQKEETFVKSGTQEKVL